ncbi:MAG: cysteine desulfurase, partial [Planctomycetaceae bacterium]|nr:cysteine desulfurase [Planctomycetaceae bacterium]
MNDTRIYFDNNATTCMLPEVVEAINHAGRTAFANPGSQHSFGRDARRTLDDARETIARILNAEESEVVFTSGGTESINMAVQGLTAGRTGTIVATAGEHPATLRSYDRAAVHGLRSLHLKVDSDGLLVESELDGLPWNQLRLVSVILAHNETGVIQRTKRLSDLCEHHRVPLLIDAVQAVGKIPVDFAALKATALAFGAHKFHGPRGVGGLLIRRGVKLVPFMEGGHQENGRRAGTEAVPLIAGMAKALEVWHESAGHRQMMISEMRNQLQQRLLGECSPAIVHGYQAERLPNTLSIAFPGLSGEALLVNLHLAEVACSLGSTCASGSAEPAPALLAMGVPPDICLATVRLSLGILNTMDEVNDA